MTPEFIVYATLTCAGIFAIVGIYRIIPMVLKELEK